MSIQQGDPIPDAKLFALDESGAPRALSASERFAGKRVVLFAVPGAFTRTCSEKHLPSFVQNAEAIKAKGIDEIVCVAVNCAPSAMPCSSLTVRSWTCTSSHQEHLG
jgi:peroxiredoxin